MGRDGWDAGGLVARSHGLVRGAKGVVKWVSSVGLDGRTAGVPPLEVARRELCYGGGG